MEKMKRNLLGIVAAVNRYPVIILLLLAIATVNMMMIQNVEMQYEKILWTLIFGVVLSLVGEQIYERFFNGIKERAMLQVASMLVTIAYYFTMYAQEVLGMEIKTAVAIFSLMMVFIWVPTIKSNMLFHQTFMATFKAFFTTILFTAVILLGLLLSIFAVDQLLMTVNDKVYSHILNLVLTLFAPLFFLSFIPVYPGKVVQMTDKQQAQIERAINCPKVLAVLLSYVIVPLSGLYTLILVAYILLNIGGDFWKNSLMEPMLLSYSITVIIVFILTSDLQNAFASIFRKVVPKVLIPLVLFQLIASFLKIGEMGITHGRYYALLFGVFAFIASIIFSFTPIQKSGWIAPILIVFSTISIIPPMDAFTVSRVSQVNLLQQTLVNNDMFFDGKIIPKSDIEVEDKIKITKLVNYLESMQYTEKIDWLPDENYNYNLFQETFGFEKIYSSNQNETSWRSAYLDRQQYPVIDIEGHDRMVYLYVGYEQGIAQEATVVPMVIDGISYTLEEDFDGEEMFITIKRDEQQLMRFNLMSVFDQVLGYESELSIEQATVTEENEFVKMSVIAHSMDASETRYNGEVYVLVEVK